MTAFDFSTALRQFVERDVVLGQSLGRGQHLELLAIAPPMTTTCDTPFCASRRGRTVQSASVRSSIGVGRALRCAGRRA